MSAAWFSSSSLSSPIGQGVRFLVVGLGNYGMSIRSRHSVGFQVVDRLARRLDAGPLRSHSRLRGAFAKCPASGIAMLRPELFMNESGKCVARCASSLQVKAANVIVVHDDLERELGKVSWKTEAVPTDTTV